jgi:hypothetical protein
MKEVVNGLNLVLVRTKFSLGHCGLKQASTPEARAFGD